MNNSCSRFAQLISIGMVSFILLNLGLRTSPAHALPKTDDPPPQVLKCLGDTQGSLSTTPQTVNLWQSATLRWNVKIPSGCAALKLYIDNQVVPPTGSRSIQPIANTSYTLRATFAGGSRTLATTAITVVLPPVVTINANHLTSLLVQALRTPGVYISVTNNVELNLSGQEYISIAAGVTLAGGRTARQPGPRLYTTTRPHVLFNVEGDKVRITGVRIQGADMGVADGDDKPKGIYNNSHVNVEIDHNELSGWSGAAVQVQDNDEKIDYVLNPKTVRIHDNFIHHNQHVGTHGYGVVVGDGAYALIERNVFDWNRHAIAGDGSDGSGYRAYRNLVLQHGGLHRWIPFPGFWTHTHQFDMHGQENCGIGDLFSDALYNCGTAGHDMEIRYNSFLYTEDNAIKLRGTPQLHPYGAFVVSNVFAHGSLGDAVHQNETGLFTSANLVGVNGMNELGTCDFDGDGINDSFLATGQTWWYSSGGDKPWVYLNTSKKRRAEVTLGFFDGDNRCDVLADGIVYPGGMPKKLLVNIPPGGGVLQ